MQEQGIIELRDSIVKKLDRFLRRNPDRNDSHPPKDNNPFALEVPKDKEKVNFIKDINKACGLTLHYNSNRANEGENEVRITGHSWNTLYNNLLKDVEKLRAKDSEEKHKSHHTSSKRRGEDAMSDTPQSFRKRLLQTSPSISVSGSEFNATPTHAATAQPIKNATSLTAPALAAVNVATPAPEMLSASALLSLTNDESVKLPEQAESTPLSSDQNKVPIFAAAPNIKSPAALMAKLGALREQNSAKKRQLEKEKQELQTALCATLEKQIQAEELEQKKLDDKAAKIKLRKEAVAKGEIIEISDTEPESVSITSPRQ